jgi:FecR protein
VNDDYLWNRSGPPDPEVERLEQLLGRYKHEAPLRVAVHRRRWPWLAVAAALMIVILGSTLAYRFYWRPGAPWEIETVDGTPTVNGHIVARHDRLGVGDTLVTDSRSRVTVRVARLGELEITPGSEVELVTTSRGRHRIALRRGTINARIWAPPFTFAVNTPAGLASDIGCAFTLNYANDQGLLRVTSGWVDFDGDTRSSLVPEGAMSELRRTLGPGTPYWHDAPDALREALREFDTTGGDAALARVLAAARPRDAMTLEHMLERARREHRGPLFDRLAQFAPPPRGVTREGVVEGNDSMIYAWREALGLGGVKKWWLQWRDALPE